MVLKRLSGFTLIEMLVVLAIIAILATLALPSYTGSVAREQVAESLGLLLSPKGKVEAFQHANASLPMDNKEAGLPEPDKLLGNYVKSIELKEGAFHITFGNKAVAALQGKVLSVRGIQVQGSPESPMSWLCGYSAMPTGMEAAAKNLSSIATPAILPMSCRDLSRQ